MQHEFYGHIDYIHVHVYMSGFKIATMTEDFGNNILIKSEFVHSNCIERPYMITIHGQNSLL